MSTGKIVALLGTIGLVVTVLLAGNIFEEVNAEDILVVQAPFSGELSWYTTAGLKWQGFGKVTHYPKRAIYEFEKRIRFNDGAHADLRGSIQYEVPIDPEHLTILHTRFGSAEAVQRQLVQTVVDKSTYMTGPLMSSKESYAEKRNQLIWFVEDQVANGIYRTRQREERIKDPLTEQEKNVTVVDLVVNKEGKPERQEEAVLSSFGIKPFNFSITDLRYEEQVEKQIAAQQQAVMDVQTAMAEAKKAEQRALTAEKEGQAVAMRAQWEQEALKVKAVTEARQQKEVAELAAQRELAVASLKAQAAIQYKAEQIARAEGDSEYRTKMMQSDGALQQKLQTYKEVNEYYAKAIADYKGDWVPRIVMGGKESNGQQNGAQMLIDLLTTKTANDLALQLKPTVMGGASSK